MSKKKNKKNKKVFNPIYDFLKREEEMDEQTQMENQAQDVQKQSIEKEKADEGVDKKTIQVKVSAKDAKHVAVDKKEAAEKVSIGNSKNIKKESGTKKGLTSNFIARNKKENGITKCGAQMGKTEVKTFDLRNTEAAKDFYEFERRVFGF